MEEKLIEEIKKHKSIYDKNCLSYHNRKTRTEDWESIAEALGSSVLICQTRWRSLRDQYIKECLKTQQASGSAGNIYKSSWKHFKIMDFLRQQMKPRNGVTSVTQDSFSSADLEQVDCVDMEEKLIKEIKKHKSIYDKSCLSYRNRNTRAKAWESVAEALGSSVLMCQTRWRRLRDQYIKESLKTQNVSGSATDVYFWKHLEIMDFLRRHVHPQKTLTSVTDSKDSFSSPEPEQEICANMEEILIGEMKKYKCLYDKSHLSYHDRKTRAEAWEAVSDTVGIPVLMCKTRWKNLRGRYMQECLKTQHPSGSTANVHESTWKFFEAMDFFSQQVQPRKRLTISVTDSKDSFTSAEPEQEISVNMEEVLIEEIKKHKCLFDKSCLQYCNRKHRAETWQSISEALGISVLICQNRWKTLRDRYVQEYQKTQLTSESSTAVYESHWDYFKIMDFLRHHVQPRRGVTRYVINLKDTSSSPEPEQVNCNNMEKKLMAEIKKNSCQSVSEALGSLAYQTYWKSIRDSKKTPQAIMDSVTDSKDSFSSVELEEVNCDPLQNTLDELLASSSSPLLQSTEAPAKRKKGKRRSSSTLQSEDFSSSSDTSTVIAEKRLCRVQAPAEPGEHQGFNLMCRDLFKKMSSRKVDDAKIFFINYLHGQIKEIRDEQL